MEEGLEAPRRRKKNPSGSKQKQTVTDVVLIKSILAVGVFFAVIGGLFLIDWQEIGGVLGISRSPAKLLRDLEYYQNKQLELIASMEGQNKEQAKAAVPQLNEVAKKLAKISFEYDGGDIIEDEDDIREHQNIAPEIHEKETKIRWEFSRKRSQHQFRLQEELNRIKRVSKIGYYVSNLINNSHSVAMRYGRELRLNKAKEGAFKRGYSPVTAGTNLTKGMQIQGIGAHFYWEDCIVKDLYPDGKVRISFHDADGSDFFGEHSGAFDEKLDRDRLRIPDVVIQKNTSPAGTPRRIQGTPQRPGGGGMGRPVITSPPSKRVPTGRSF